MLGENGCDSVLTAGASSPAGVQTTMGPGLHGGLLVRSLGDEDLARGRARLRPGRDDSRASQPSPRDRRGRSRGREAVVFLSVRRVLAAVRSTLGGKKDLVIDRLETVVVGHLR